MVLMRKYGSLLLLAGLALLMLACNLGQRIPAATLQPTSVPAGVRATPRVIPSITPLFGGSVATAVPGGATPVFGAQTGGTLGVTLAPRSTPGSVTVTIPTGQIGNFLSYVVNNIILPIANIAINMIGSSATYLWQMAGAQGGWIGQVGCCIVPLVVLLVVVVRGGRRGRRRWLGIF